MMLLVASAASLPARLELYRAPVKLGSQPGLKLNLTPKANNPCQIESVPKTACCLAPYTCDVRPECGGGGVAPPADHHYRGGARLPRQQPPRRDGRRGLQPPLPRLPAGC